MSQILKTDEIIKKYIENGGSDIYCDLIVPKKISVELIYESDLVMVIKHTKPLAQYHYVITPKKHILDINDASFADIQTEILKATRLALSLIPYHEVGAKVESNLGIFQNSKHLHIHVVGGKFLSN